MSTRSGERYQDDALARAWKAHSTERPPPHVDATILAAAHREAHAKPQAVDESDEQARRPARAWWPLAAAATIAAIAFGVVELAPPIVDNTTIVASDVPAQQASKPLANATTSEATRAQPEQGATASMPQAQRAAPPRADDRIAGATGSRAAPAARSDQASGTPKREAKARADESGRSLAGQGAPAPAAPPAPSGTEGWQESVQSFARPFPAAPSPAGRPADPPPSTESRLEPRPVAPLAAPLERSRRATEAAPAAAAPSHAPMTDQAPARIAPDAESRARIERIRVFHAGSMLAQAVQELQALRRTHPDADALLPPELRAWAASVPRER